ncbi:MAG: chromosome segregation protein SMC [Ectothiorhodospiraceae bacterium]|jgi:chromosome segregation protein
MRLTRIKLSGFKSFVDPTTVPLPGDLVAIVGPNGCGKSNIIDAVRWVMGESSAKHLRGESMADVIFDGSSSRKPVGTAGIELIFDNSDGSLTGKYASYNEISVKRQVNREGQSAYYLNGTRCRKRDITDVFLGTGLGPRSYSIIEQGMISRVIEARPEDLRAYLEEAAGISLYKERRKETERRIRDTLENLERLDDVRDEVGRQLEKLARQAETAERYKSLKAEQRQRQAELHVLKLSDLEEERETLRRELSERENAMEAEVASQRGLEREAEEVRARHADDSDRLNEIQGRYYSLGSDIARIEQQITHQRELRQKSVTELERNRDAIADLDRTLEQDREKLAVLRERLSELEPESEEAVEAEEMALETVEQIQSELDAWRERWEGFNEDASEPVRVAQVERARIEQLERRGEEIERRRQRLEEESGRLRLDDLQAEIEELEQRDAELAEDIAAEREHEAEAQQRLAELREQAEERADELSDARGALQRDQARLTSLDTLQQAALGNDDGVEQWLAHRGIDGAARLAQSLQVEPGWERAVEAVLGDTLQAVVVEDRSVDAASVDALEQGRVMLYAPDEREAAPALKGAGLLNQRVEAPWPLDDLFGRIHCAEDLAAATSMASGLGADESVVTPDGIWMGRRWVRLRAADDGSEAGVLAREREIESLREAIATAEERGSALGESLESVQASLREAEERRDEVQEELAEREREQAGVQAQLETRRGRLDEARERRENLAAELEELAEERSVNTEDIRAARGRLEEAMDRSEALDAERERLTEEKLEIQERLDTARERLQECRSRRHDVALKAESATTARTSLEEGIARMETQRQRLAERDAELEESIAEIGDPGERLAEEREALLERRLQVEEELTRARERLQEADHRLRELEQNRSQVEQRVTELRESLESARFRDYELKVRAQTQTEALTELGFDHRTVAENLPENAAAAEWEKELERLEARVKRLGPINLAAIEEHEQLKERKGYLDAQHEDLSEALETLQSAIRRIDRETRTRFKETFEKVNEGMQRLFPRLFGGGQGYLELTGEDLLETGVTIMARPPGKKITNIHLMSGGEKALTAVSLVFAIFELNPAPFCMLDEVDAPLDEANVGRFCDMLREMSDRVQFIVITHNKTTMEAATHLMGVTMNEPGVSRMVAVDVDAAAEMAAG